MNCCNIDFDKKNTWYLQSLNSLDKNKMFIKRQLNIGYCPICGDEIVELIEVRASDNKMFSQTFYGKKCEKIKQNEKKRILYTLATDTACANDWIYGINKEIKNKRNGTSCIRQYAYSYATKTSKGLVKSFKVEKNG